MSREVGSRAVYVIGSADNPVKIGVADRVKRRLMELQIGSPDLLYVHHQVKVPWELAEKIESAAHAELSARHRHGEWFNVHKDEAAEVVDRLKAKLLLERQRHAYGRGDLIDALEAGGELHRKAREAVCDYRDRLDIGDTQYVGHANGFVLEKSGMAAYAAFSIVIAQRKPLSGLNGRELERAHAALARALNALVEFNTGYRFLKADHDWVRRYSTLDRQEEPPPGSTLKRLRAAKAA